MDREQNLIGAYGLWAAEIVGRKPGTHSLRSGQWDHVAAWREKARARVWECLAAPELPETPAVEVEWSGIVDGLYAEKLSYQLPYGPRTEAVFLKPAGAVEGERLPGLLALHDHGGNKYFGWRKIAQVDESIHPLLQDHRQRSYGGLAWANEIARQGYAVLVNDTFPFASRRVRIADVSDVFARGVQDPGPEETPEKIIAYNRWAGEHEDIMAKALFSAGTTWPGVYLREDQVALSILCARPDVDAERVGCGGLSGGGMRTVYLAGLDDRIRCCVCVGFMTTWQDLVLFKNYTHTWMTYTPLLPRALDFPEILGLRAPQPALVLHCTEDPLFTDSEVQICGQTLTDVYTRAKAPEAFRLSNYPGGHKFDAPMQQEAFAWLDRWLKA
jgi:dienelactone hydrolase